MTSPRIVVDTSALIAMMNGEADEDWFAGALEAAPTKLMSAGSVQEFLLVAANRAPASTTGVLNDAWEMLSLFDITVVPVTGELALLGAAGASRFRPSPARLNYGDGFAYALAKAYDCPILCKGDDFVHTDVDVVRPV
jgi:ribonuclease VapC